MKGRKAVEKVYGFAFPDDLYAFDEFWQKNASFAQCLEIGVDGPFEVLHGRAPKGFDPGCTWPRFYKDPPELFTVMIGNTDGLHWGYWFDDPNDRETDPVVVSYHHNDAFQIGIDGTSLFEALRADLELSHRDAEQNLVDDPDYADDYRKRLDDFALLRDAMAEYDLGDRAETGEAYHKAYCIRAKPPASRKPVAKTRNDMGIIVPKKQYRALAKKDPFETWNYKPKAREVASFVANARAMCADGLPGAALKLGHDLWTYEFAAESYAMLDLAYEALDREILRDYLTRAIEFRRACDAKRE